MLRLILLGILLIVIARLFWRLVDSIIGAAGGAEPRARAAMKLVRDPVCGTYVAPRSALSLTAGGDTLYFCSQECRAKYSRQ